MYALVVNLKNEKVVVVAMYVVAVLLAVSYYNNFYMNVMFEMGTVTNASYTVLYFLPFMLCVRKSFFRLAAILITFLVVMISMKRGGFFALILSVVVFFYIDRVSIKGRKIKIWGWFLVLLIIVSGYFLIVRINTELLENMLFDRVADSQASEGSGRMGIYRDVINQIGSNSIIGFLFGNGWAGTARDTFSHLTAHNDYLEVLYDFGIIAFVLYVSFVVQLLKMCRRLIAMKSEYAPAIGASLAIFFVNSMVSHIWIYNQYLIIFALFWGFINAVEKKHYYNENRNSHIPCCM